jgi:hypothetical protein
MEAINMENKMYSVRWGVVLAVLTILFGFFLGAAMGGAEAGIRDYWQSLAQPGLAGLYQNDPQKISTVVGQSWKMLQRAHMHAAAIGTASLVLMVVIANLKTKELYKQTAAWFLGLGGLGYSLSWFLVAFRAPVVGNIHVAKDGIHLLAAPSIGLLLAGTAIVLVLGIKAVFSKEN